MAGLTRSQRIAKRILDLALAVGALTLTWWILVIAIVAATIDTGQPGLFVQRRVGREGRLFPILKVRTMRAGSGRDTSVTTADDPRVTRLGRLLRRTKIDELPQLFNVLAGHMSFVGPRPDVPGFADRMDGPDRIILSVRPGITGPASLQFRNEEALLAAQEDPERFNREVLFPEKLRLNRAYVENYRVADDVVCLVRTVLGDRGGRT
jgi:lipopolysaccharide/colanic/teichoic acid biosynthesis glycosyltransferase